MTFGVGVFYRRSKTEPFPEGTSLLLDGGVLTTKVSLLSKIGLPVSPR